MPAAINMAAGIFVSSGRFQDICLSWVDSAIFVVRDQVLDQTVLFHELIFDETSRKLVFGDQLDDLDLGAWFKASPPETSFSSSWESSFIFSFSIL